MSDRMTTRPLSILALVTEAYGAQGGIAQYNRDLLSALAASPEIGSIHVLALAGGAAPHDGPAKVYRLTAPAGRLGYVAAAARHALGHRYDMIFCGHLHLAPLAAALSLARRVPVVTQLHGIEIWGAVSPARRWALECCQTILCVSRDTRRRVLAAARIDPERVIVLPNTVDPVYRPGDRAAARARFGLGDLGRVLLTVGRLDAREAYKGHDRVIAALPALLAQEPGLSYVVAGDGDDRQRLEALARETGVSGSVRFLGYVPAPDLPELYRAADVFVMPSTGEGFGIVYLEAMASGTPAVGLAAGGAPDALGDGTLGHMATQATLAAVIRTALGASLTSTALSEAVARRFGREAFTAHVDALLRAFWRPALSNSPRHS